MCDVALNVSFVAEPMRNQSLDEVGFALKVPTNAPILKLDPAKP